MGREEEIRQIKKIYEDIIQKISSNFYHQKKRTIIFLYYN